MSEHTEISDEMRSIGETLMGRWGPINDYDDDTGDKRDTIEAMCLLFPEGTNEQLAVVVSMAHGSCHKDEVEEVRS